MYNLLTEEEIKMFLDNKALVYYIVNNLGYNKSMPEYEDFVSEGSVGLIKAIKKFDSSRNIKFATWAIPCITNEIFMYLRKNKKHNGVLSLEQPTTDNLCLGNMIEDEKAYFVEELEDSEDYAKILYYILNYLSSTQRTCILYKLGKKTQQEVAKRLDISQSYVSRIVTKTIKKLKTAIINNYKCKEEFLVKETGKKYTVVFSSKNVKNFKALFLNLLGDFSEEIPNFKWYSNSERSTVQMIISEKAYSFLAEFIQGMDEFEITLVSKNVSENPAESRKDKINMLKPYKEEKEIREDEDEIYEDSGGIPKMEEIPAVVQETTDYCNAGRETHEASNKIETEFPKKKEERHLKSKTNRSKAIRNYIMETELEIFSCSDLMKAFPNEKKCLVSYILHDMKEKNMIESINRGVYKVIKNN